MSSFFRVKNFRVQKICFSLIAVRSCSQILGVLIDLKITTFGKVCQYGKTAILGKN